ncbi:MAG: hypothetical protein JO352_21030 [Chloroflexi bacterium]|nr:hypothetical protein [Chloroflexota bacterium]MBV9603151.1 hypothetical protein [Chloroflexota bacterium]
MARPRRVWKTEAIDAVLALHHLPASDRGLVLGWARNDVRAALFANLVAAYKKGRQPAQTKQPQPRA